MAAIRITGEVDADELPMSEDRRVVRDDCALSINIALQREIDSINEYKYGQHAQFYRNP